LNNLRNDSKIRISYAHVSSKSSKDCIELQDIQLELIGKGAETDRWPVKLWLDKSLKIAQERYDVLC